MQVVSMALLVMYTVVGGGRHRSYASDCLHVVFVCIDCGRPAQQGCRAPAARMSARGPEHTSMYIRLPLPLPPASVYMYMYLVCLFVIMMMIIDLVHVGTYICATLIYPAEYMIGSPSGHI